MTATRPSLSLSAVLSLSPPELTEIELEGSVFEILRQQTKKQGSKHHPAAPRQPIFIIYYVYYAIRQNESQNTSENNINSQHLHPSKNTQNCTNLLKLIKHVTEVLNFDGYE